ncbi:VOC family protein [Staphylococcus lutrae]|uniref:Glyoxalase-like domain-containing protein n=1 Tax=Staphylococcus lutrae TaxID=155085 RepID=A0AAC9WIX8_9STAP|nr:VOC family protein [Staphylococcus lutrae]ARJ50418.1 hypothetical protein B5P37_03385 [Staphylococcus lutrae]PNZ38764.1 VOC family protein [Staphylococcus lutrae]
MLDIEFDHVIHYIDGLNQFEFPGKYLEIQNGGQHEALGTFNRLVHIDLTYIELLDIFHQGKVKQQAKSDAGKHSFATSIIDSGYKQGFKKICFRTHNLMQLKAQLEERGLETVGPLKMTRENKKGDVIHWQLLYINHHQFDVMMPFFIEWQKSDEAREAEFQPYFHTHLTVDMIALTSYQRQTMVNHWKHWFDMEEIESSERYTILQRREGTVKFKITEGKENEIEGIQFLDQSIDAPIAIRTRGASYQFIPHHT